MVCVVVMDRKWIGLTLAYLSREEDWYYDDVALHMPFLSFHGDFLVLAKI